MGSTSPNNKYEFRSLRLFVKFLMLVFILPATAWSQQSTTPVGSAPGNPAGTYSLSQFENLNLYSVNLNFNLPWLHIGVPGGAQTSLHLALHPFRWKAD